MFLNDRRRKQVETEQHVTEMQSHASTVDQDQVEQLSFPDTAKHLALYPDAPAKCEVEVCATSQGAARSAGNPVIAPGTKKMTLVQLPPTAPGEPNKAETGEINLSALKKDTHTTSRLPIVIPGNGVKRAAVVRQRSATKRRLVVHATSSIILGLILFGAFAAVLPVDTKGHSNGLGFFSPFVDMLSSKKNDTSLIAAQAATATAVTQDGYEHNGAGGNMTYQGVNTTFHPTPIPAPSAPSAPSVPAGGTVSNSNFNNPFTAGQCTYWADYRYHQLTGYAIPWTGNAMTWSSQAPSYGWIASSQPHLYSVIVLQPGTQYAGSYGHVAVVERINSDGSVYTSNWNWTGGWMQTTYVTFHTGSGVSFVWHP